MYVWGVLDFESDSDRPGTKENPSLYFPVRVPDLPSKSMAKSFSCGTKHIVAIFENSLYGMGANHSDQIGPGIPECNLSFVKLSSFHKCCEETPVEVCCGTKHTLVRCVDGSVWSVGSNEFGQTGNGLRKGWGRVPFDGPVEQLAAGGDTSFAISAGKVYSWGAVEHGSLAHGTKGEVEMLTSGPAKFENVKKPTLVQWFVAQRLAIVEVAAGPQHMIARTDTDVYCAGQGFFGKLGNGSVQEELLPRRVVFPQRKHCEALMQIAAGRDHSCALKRSAEYGTIVYIWGRRFHHLDGYNTPELFTIVPDLCRIQCGKNFTMAVSAQGKLYVWGGCAYCAAMGRPNGHKKEIFTEVTALEGKFIVDVKGSNSLFVAVADDSKAAADSSLDVVVPLQIRYPANDFDAAVSAYYTRVLGPVSGPAYVSSIPRPAPLDTANAYVCRGAKNLHVGSKVRVRMGDVDALGVVSTVHPEGHSANSFEIRWTRDDWDPEVVELFSDDEGIDEENPCRWQSLWFLSIPGDLTTPS